MNYPKFSKLTEHTCENGETYVIEVYEHEFHYEWHVIKTLHKAESELHRNVNDVVELVGTFIETKPKFIYSNQIFDIDNESFNNIMEIINISNNIT